jgi:hypothetical protein
MIHTAFVLANDLRVLAFHPAFVHVTGELDLIPARDVRRVSAAEVVIEYLDGRRQSRLPGQAKHETCDQNADYHVRIQSSQNAFVR